MVCGKCGCGTSKGLCPVSLGLGIGVACALSMLFFALSVMWFDYGTVIIEQYGSIYVGYGPTFLGALIGAFWGLVHGFIFGFIAALVYNCISRCCKARCCSGKNGCTCGCSCCGKDAKGKM